MFYQIITIFSLFIKSLAINGTNAKSYILKTGFITLTICGLLMYGIWTFSSVAGNYISDLVPLQWMHESLLFSFIIGVATFLLFVMMMKYIIIIALSPLLSVVSERTEIAESGSNEWPKFSFISSATRSVRVNMRNILKELFITAALFFMSFIPLVNIITLPLMFIIQAYFAGFGIMDYYLERHYTFKESLDVVNQNKWAAITLGGVFLSMLAIPIVGMIFAPYLATVASTRYLYNKGQNSANKKGQ